MRIVTVFLVACLIGACTKKQPACTGEQVQLLLLSAYKKDLQAYLADKAKDIQNNYEKIYPVNTDTIVASYLLNGTLKVENLATTEKKENENACTGKATLTYRLSDDFITAYKRNAPLVTDQDALINPGFETTNVDVEIVYTISVTDGKEQVRLEDILTDDLHRSLDQFVFFYSLNEVVKLKLKEGK